MLQRNGFIMDFIIFRFAVENMMSLRILRLLRFMGNLVLRGSFNGGVVGILCLVEICFSVFNLVEMTKVMIIMMGRLAWLVLVVWLSPTDLCDYNLYKLFELLLLRGFPREDAGDVDNKDCGWDWDGERKVCVMDGCGVGFVRIVEVVVGVGLGL